MSSQRSAQNWRNFAQLLHDDYSTNEGSKLYHQTSKSLNFIVSYLYLREKKLEDQFEGGGGLYILELSLWACKPMPHQVYGTIQQYIKEVS